MNNLNPLYENYITAYAKSGVKRTLKNRNKIKVYAKKKWNNYKFTKDLKDIEDDEND